MQAASSRSIQAVKVRMFVVLRAPSEDDREEHRGQQDQEDRDAVDARGTSGCPRELPAQTWFATNW